jgi:hypothetical protein
MNALRGNDRFGFGPVSRIVAVLAALAALGGCETGGQTGALAGAGIGALIGQAAGGDTEATLIGAAVGTGLGYIIGNEADKKHAQEMEKTSAPTYQHQETGVLAGTRWQVVSLAPADYAPPFASKILEFDRNGQVITTTTYANGHVETTTERYRVVGGTLIINKPGYIVNAKFGIEGDELIVDSEEFRAVLKRLRP